MRCRGASCPQDAPTTTKMVQANEEVMPECDSRPSTSGSGPWTGGGKGGSRWPGGARPKVFGGHRSFSSGSRPSVLSRASGSLRSGGSTSRLGSRNSLLSGTAHDSVSTNTSRLRRELPSISDICGYDEVQELLRDIETLECRRWNSDWETFTIQSSHPDLDLPNDFDIFSRDLDLLSRCESRLSWDSHGGQGGHDGHSTNSSSRGSSPAPRRPIPTLTLAWDDSHLKTSVGIFRLLLVVSPVYLLYQIK